MRAVRSRWPRVREHHVVMRASPTGQAEHLREDGEQQQQNGQQLRDLPPAGAVHVRFRLFEQYPDR
jgi:hypothetical protein